VVGGGGADLMLWFRLNRGGNETKCCQKMKQRQRARLGSMEKKRDNVGQRRGGTGEGKGRKQRQLG
jgi:hypothetical protein